jgi:hypothetical protein
MSLNEGTLSIELPFCAYFVFEEDSFPGLAIEFSRERFFPRRKAFSIYRGPNPAFFSAWLLFYLLKVIVLALCLPGDFGVIGMDFSPDRDINSGKWPLETFLEIEKALSLRVKGLN